jgi:biopolymer transport protein TolQ
MAGIAAKKFEKLFWSGQDLNKIYLELGSYRGELHGLEHIFYTGFGEYLRYKKQNTVKSETILDGAQRVMKIAFARETAFLEQHLSSLATIGSISPYIGLFGTVCGIMTSFRALGESTQQATMAMVAPGISEALFTTAMGLFAAIPAVIAYNRYSSETEKLSNLYDTFREEFSNILHRQII